MRPVRCRAPPLTVFLSGVLSTVQAKGTVSHTHCLLCARVDTVHSGDFAFVLLIIGLKTGAYPTERGPSCLWSADLAGEKAGRVRTAPWLAEQRPALASVAPLAPHIRQWPKLQQNQRPPILEARYL